MMKFRIFLCVTLAGVWQASGKPLGYEISMDNGFKVDNSEYIPSVSYSSDDSLFGGPLNAGLDLWSTPTLKIKKVLANGWTSSFETDLSDDTWLFGTQTKHGGLESKHSLGGTLTDLLSLPTYKYHLESEKGNTLNYFDFTTDLDDDHWWEIGREVKTDDSRTAYGLEGNFEDSPYWRLQHTIGNEYDKKPDYTFSIDGDFAHAPYWGIEKIIPTDTGNIRFKAKSNLGEDHQLSMANEWSKGKVDGEAAVGVNFDSDDVDISGNLDMYVKNSNDVRTTFGMSMISDTRYPLEAYVGGEWDHTLGKTDVKLSTDFLTKPTLELANSWEFGHDMALGVSGETNFGEEYKVGASISKGALSLEVTKDETGWGVNMPLYKQRF